MSPTVSQVLAWNPNALISTAEGVDGLVARLDERMGDLAAGQNTLVETWDGIAADSATARIERERSTAGRVTAALGGVAQAYREGAASIASVREHLTSLVHSVRSRGFQIADDGTVDASGLVGWLVLAPPAARDVARLELEREAAELTIAVVDALRQAGSAATQVIGRVRDSFAAVTSAGQAALPGRFETSGTGAFSWKPDVPATVAASTVGMMVDATRGGLVSAAEASGDDVARLIGRGMGPFGVVLGAVPAIANDIDGGMDTTKAVTTEVAGAGFGLFAGGLAASMASGAVAGSAAGSAVPGLGTAVGLVVGALAGGVAAYGGSKGLQRAWG
ncbi:WXG100 family type VII secretion target [Rhodococcus sp. SGAir0479]|uniref:WXG100 family type VII secretion target n=1 Tax=Rhodococcus sp. SGAir0479 TaxID=2567884 RepID=UPI0010CD268C|nr:hypothetical protein [Rhodococcus sp. SGAir0479]QCQ90443.1 hypothetical protein E7742_03865 [Rhodococcus sp. SGAir0479]